MFESWGEWRPAPRCRACRKVFTAIMAACPGCGHNHGLTQEPMSLAVMMGLNQTPDSKVRWYEMVVARPLCRRHFLLFGHHTPIRWEVKPTDAEAADALMKSTK